jgi:hypothetical protein
MDLKGSPKSIGMKPMASAEKSSRSSVLSESKMKRSESTPRYVLCIKNQGYSASLEVRKVYEALPDAEAEQHGMLRVVDESSEDYLYPRDFFVPISLPKAAQAAFPGAGQSP